MNLNQIASAFADHMCTIFGVEIVPKESALEMQLVGLGMEIGRVFGMGTATKDEFLHDITTTIGTRIYMPSSHREDPMEFMSTLTHECQHALQFKDGGIEFGILYLKEAEARVRYEADAYAAGLAIDHWFTGQIPSPDHIEAIVQGLILSYHVRPEDAQLAADMIRSHVASLRSGVVMTRSARNAISWLNKNHPQLKGSAQ